jgi:hypothetical protein
MCNRVLWLATAVLLTAVIGCNSKEKLYRVTGQVTIDGQPAPTGVRVNFEPTDAGGQVASGLVDEAGNYTLYTGSEGREGAVPGSYKVYLAPSYDTDAYMEGPPGRPSGIPGVPSAGPIPEEYLAAGTSPLTVEVGQSANQIDITIP